MFEQPAPVPEAGLGTLQGPRTRWVGMVRERAACRGLHVKDELAPPRF